VNEFGDFDLDLADQLEPDWHYTVTNFDFSRERQAATVVADR
jgi:hypothetical protein